MSSQRLVSVECHSGWVRLGQVWNCMLVPTCLDNSALSMPALKRGLLLSVSLHEERQGAMH